MSRIEARVVFKNIEPGCLESAPGAGDGCAFWDLKNQCCTSATMPTFTVYKVPFDMRKCIYFNAFQVAECENYKPKCLNESEYTRYQCQKCGRKFENDTTYSVHACLK